MNEELGFDNSGGINNEVTNGVDNKSSEDYSQFAIPDSEQHKEDNELETDVFEASFDEQTLEEAKKNNKKKKHDKKNIFKDNKSLKEMLGNKGIVQNVFNPTSILYKLIAAFLVPVICIIVLGIFSYNSAADALTSSYTDRKSVV